MQGHALAEPLLLVLTHHCGLRCHLVLHDGMALTSEELLRLVDPCLEVFVRTQELLLLRDGQVDEHTSDLGGLLRADELVNIVVNAIADLYLRLRPLELRVILDASRDDALGLKLVKMIESDRHHWCGLRAGIHAPRATFVEVVLTPL